MIYLVVDYTILFCQIGERKRFFQCLQIRLRSHNVFFFIRITYQNIEYQKIKAPITLVVKKQYADFFINKQFISNQC